MYDNPDDIKDINYFNPSDIPVNNIGTEEYSLISNNCDNNNKNIQSDILLQPNEKKTPCRVCMNKLSISKRDM